MNQTTQGFLQQNPFKPLVQGLSNLTGIGKPYMPANTATPTVAPVSTTPALSINPQPTIQAPKPTPTVQPAPQPLAQSTPATPSYTLPSGLSGTIDQLNTYNQPQVPRPQTFESQAVDQQGNVPSTLLESQKTYRDLLSKRAEYEQQYADALMRAAQVNATGAQRIEDARYTGETQGFAQGMTEREQRNAQLASLAATGQAEAYGKLLGVNQQNITNTLATANETSGLQTSASGDVFSQTRNPITGQTELTSYGNIYNGTFTGQPTSGQIGGFGGGGGQGYVPPAIQSAINYAGDAPFIDLSTLTSAQIPLAQQYAAQNGIPLLNAADSTKLKDASSTFASAESLLSTVENYANKIITAQSTFDVPAQYLRTKLGSVFKTNPDAVVFDSSVSAFSSLLTRAAGEKGTLTDADVARIINGLPTRTDTVESAAKKVEALRSIYQSVKDGVFNSYLGSKSPQGASGGGVVQTSIGAINTDW